MVILVTDTRAFLASPPPTRPLLPATLPRQKQASYGPAEVSAVRVTKTLD
jgi:hypothetical protein